ncbi:unnamed protein product [Acanthoscelides obtectus]|uniref:DUF1279 domain-containing protein n=1 Tax=Acanthoscelides obtectus TaxID=200917 RepID=A0A9P0NZ84_ACAOB|nr:unnamed protein product [Acanthoscelides obtectus]CAK1668115.1 Protein FAM210B, mitochondrial [Acanthoscelides obtectus]
MLVGRATTRLVYKFLLSMNNSKGYQTNVKDALLEGLCSTSNGNRCTKTLYKYNISPLLVHSSQHFSNEAKAAKTEDTARPASKVVMDDPKTVIEEPNDTKKLTMKDKLKKAVKEYGSTVIVFHVSISLVSLGTCYFLVSTGLDVVHVLQAIGLQEWATKSQVAANAGTFAVAYVIHKAFAPVRITITLGSVPFIVRYLRKVGFLKKI